MGIVTDESRVDYIRDPPFNLLISADMGGLGNAVPLLGSLRPPFLSLVKSIEIPVIGGLHLRMREVDLQISQ